MAEGFKIADGFVEIEARYDEARIRAAGEQAGEQFTRGADGRLRDSRGRFAASLGDVFDQGARGAAPSVRKSSKDSIGKGMLDGVGSAFSGGLLNVLTMGLKGGSITSAFATNPWVAGIGAALGAAIGVVAVPFVGAAINGLIGAGAGLGMIGLAGFLLKDEPAVKSAGEQLMKTLKGTFTDAARPMIQPIADAMDELGLILSGDNVFPQVQAIFADLGQYVKPLATGLGELVENTLPGFREFMATVGGPALQVLADKLPEIGDALSDMFSEFAGGGEGATLALRDLLDFTINSIIQIGLVIGWLSKAYVSVREFFTSIPGWVATAGQWFSDLWSTISTWASNTWATFTSIPGRIGAALSSLWATITAPFIAVGSWFASLPGLIGGHLSALGSTLMGWLSTAGSWFAALPGRIWAGLAAIPELLGRVFLMAFDAATFAIGYGIGLAYRLFVELPAKIGAAIASIPALLGTLFTNAWNLARSVVSAGVAAVVAFFQQLPGRAAAVLSVLWGAISGAFNTAVANARSAATNLVNGVVSFLSSLPGRAAGALSALWGAISGAFNSAVNNARNAASNLVNGVVSFLSALPGRAASAVSGIAGAVSGALRGAIGAASSIGSQIISGLIGGINSMIGAAVAAAKRAVGNIVAGAKSALGISSPSKVFADEVGAWIPPGIADGIAAALPAAMDKLRDSWEALTAATSSRFGNRVVYGQVSQGIWDELYRAGWRGDPNDGMEALYKPLSVTDPSAYAGIGGGSAGGSRGGVYIAELNVTIPARDLADIQSITEFFARIQQAARRGSGSAMAWA